MTTTARALGRALLHRQLLLRRADLGPEAALTHLVGLQAQAPDPPYLGLWTRLTHFPFHDLARLLTERRAVRMTLLRATLHLVTADDALALRPLLQPALDRARRPTGPDPDQVAAAAATLLAAEPLTAADLGRRLAPHWPDTAPAELAALARTRLPLVQVPPRGLWGMTGPARHTTLHTWLGPRPHPQATLTDLVTRYLAAFGPATVADIQTWSGLTGLRPVVESLPLRRDHDEHGRLLHDLPEAPRPDPDTPAPARYLPAYDNLLLSHADRTRVIDDAHRRAVITTNGIVHPTILLDGRVRGTWRRDRHHDERATLTVRPFAPLTPADAEALTAEGHRLLAATDPDTTHQVRIERPAR